MERYRLEFCAKMCCFPTSFVWLVGASSFPSPVASDGIRGTISLTLQPRRLSSAPVRCCFSGHGVSTSGWPLGEAVCPGLLNSRLGQVKLSRVDLKSFLGLLKA